MKSSEDPKIPQAEAKQPSAFPSAFQKRTIWMAITAVSIAVIASIAVGTVFLGSKILGLLQPLLVPIAVAAIIAYLLNPVIEKLSLWTRWSRSLSTKVVFIAFLMGMVLLMGSVLVPSFGQARNLVDNWDKYQPQLTEMSRDFADDIQRRFDHPLVRKYSQEYYARGVSWLAEEGPKMGQKIGSWTWDRLLGAFGFFGYLLGLLMVPLYLYYFLKEGHSIKKYWGDYLPLRASQFKDEVVETLTEINQYLISFFRGQMVVSLIDGVLIAVALSLLQLPHAVLIGVFLALLGLIPYIGNLIVMIPALIIATVHFGSRNTIDYPLTTEVRAGQIMEVSLPDAGTGKKYISKVSDITLVKVKGNAAKGEAEVVEAFIPHSTTPAGPPVAGEVPAALPEIPSAGSVMQVMLPNGLSETREIVEVTGHRKRVWYLVHAWSFLPQVWVYPLIVLGIFVVLQYINGLVTAPKIVGDSVGLHPLTVIFSILFWTFVLGGLLGALLAVPLTASVKVLFQRYIWARKDLDRLATLKK